MRWSQSGWESAGNLLADPTVWEKVLPRSQDWSHHGGNYQIIHLSCPRHCTRYLIWPSTESFRDPWSNVIFLTAESIWSIFTSDPSFPWIRDHVGRACKLLRKTGVQSKLKWFLGLIQSNSPLLKLDWLSQAKDRSIWKECQYGIPPLSPAKKQPAAGHTRILIQEINTPSQSAWGGASYPQLSRVVMIREFTQLFQARK